MGWEDRITVNPAVRSGKPCIKGTRIAVYDVLEYLAGGMSEEQILGDFPDLKREDVGNAGTAQILALLQKEQQRVETFAGATDASLLILSIGASAV